MSSRVFFSNVPFSTSLDQLRQLFEVRGHVVEFCPFTNKGTNTFKGMGVVEYSSPVEAQRAISELLDVNVEGRPLWVTEDSEDKKRQPMGGLPVDETPSASSRRVFFSNVPFSTQEGTLVETFQMMGEVEELQLFHNATGFRGMGVCTYKTPEEAAEAISRLRDIDVDGRPLWVAEDTGKKLQVGSQTSLLPAKLHRAQLPREVFFSNVPYNTTEDSLRDVFCSAGEVINVQLFRQKTGESRGMGVVTFQDPESVQRAVQTLRDLEVGDRKMWVATHSKTTEAEKFAPPSAKVFFSNVPFNVGEDQLRTLFSEVGVVLELNLFADKEGRSRGMGHCTFQVSSQAAAAIRVLRDRDVGGRPIWIAEDNKSPQPQAAAAPLAALQQMARLPYGAYGAQALQMQQLLMSQMVAPMIPMQAVQPSQSAATPSTGRIFFSNVPFDVYEAQLEPLFTSVGPITDLHLMKSADGRSRGMGHVTYASAELAALAIQQLMDRDVGGRPILVKADRSERVAAPPRAPTPRPPRQLRGPPPGEAPATSSKIFFSNVPYTVSEDELMSLFQQVGAVMELNLFRNDQGRSRGMGHCLFQTPAEAQAAIQELRDVNVGGRPIWIAEDSRGRTPGAPGAPRARAAPY